jgi:single-strand DNA-binding protein
MNRIHLQGFVGGDPEIHRTQDGRPIATFSVATSESWKDKSTGERKEKTEWHRVVVFVPWLVERVEAGVNKGSLVTLIGQNQTRKYEKDGVERYTTEVVLRGYDADLQVCKTFPKGDRAPPPTGDDDPRGVGSRAPASSSPGRRGDMDDEIPF